jgi:hypothetical protein
MAERVIDSDELRAKMEAIARRPDLYQVLINSLGTPRAATSQPPPPAPSIYEHNVVKMGILCQLFGGAGIPASGAERTRHPPPSLPLIPPQKGHQRPFDWRPRHVQESAPSVRPQSGAKGHFHLRQGHFQPPSPPFAECGYDESGQLGRRVNSLCHKGFRDWRKRA